MPGSRNSPPAEREVRAGGRKRGKRGARPWGENSRARAKAIVLACLNYGVRKLNLPPHPLRHVRPGTVGRREHYLTPEERKKIKEAVRGSFADYVFALEHTGARPFSEVATITAADVNLEEGTWVLTKWKNARKQKGKKRTIYLVGSMLELTRRLAERHPEGPLFRNKNGKPWMRQALTARFRTLGERLGIPGLSAYMIRHCFISDALARGVPVAVVAELCGTSIETIQKHYNHLNVKHDVLREAMKQAVGG
jgi:integrase